MWASIDGHGDFARLDTTAARIIEKRVEDVRDPKVLGITREQITAVSIEAASSKLSIRRQDNSWESEHPAGLELDRASVERILVKLADVSAVEIIRDPDRAALIERNWTGRVSVQIAGRGSPEVLYLMKEEGQAGPVASVAGRDFVYRLKDTASELIGFTAEDVRRRSVLSVDAASVVAVGITLPDGRTARLIAPPRGSPDSHWSIVRSDGVRETSPTITTVAGGAMSLAAVGFVDNPRPAQVTPDRIRITYFTGSGNVVVSVSSDLRQQGYVAAVEGDRSFARQALLLPRPVIDSLASIAGGVSNETGGGRP